MGAVRELHGILRGSIRRRRYVLPLQTADRGQLIDIEGARILFSYGIYSGGPAALWSSMLITVVFMTITAASLAEICSSIPLRCDLPTDREIQLTLKGYNSGSIYIWAAEAGGRKYGRFFGFIVAFWSTTAWTSFVACVWISCLSWCFAEQSNFVQIKYTSDNKLYAFRTHCLQHRHSRRL